MTVILHLRNTCQVFGPLVIEYCYVIDLGQLVYLSSDYVLYCHLSRIYISLHWLLFRSSPFILHCILTSNCECEAPSSFLSSCSRHLTGVCPSIYCRSCVDSQDVFIVDLSIIVPFYFTWSIWTGPGVAEWCSIR